MCYYIHLRRSIPVPSCRAIFQIANKLIDPSSLLSAPVILTRLALVAAEDLRCVCGGESLSSVAWFLIFCSLFLSFDHPYHGICYLLGSAHGEHFHPLPGSFIADDDDG